MNCSDAYNIKLNLFSCFYLLRGFHATFAYISLMYMNYIQKKLTPRVLANFKF